MKIRKVALFALFGIVLFASLAYGEDNNPCLHPSWGSTQYDCSTSLSWLGGPPMSCSNVLSFSSIKSAAESRTSKSGSCKKYHYCSTCGIRQELGTVAFGEKTASCTSPNPLAYDETSTPRSLRPGSYSFTISASCHTTRSCYGSIVVEGHNQELSTARSDRRVLACYMTGRPPHNLSSHQVSVRNVTVPLGSSHSFGIDWSHPTTPDLTNGKEYFKKALCTKCSVVWHFSETPMQQQGPGEHLVEHPVPTGGGTYQPGAYYAYLFLFDQLGTNFKVHFEKRCKDRKVDIRNWNPKQISLFPCTDGEYEYGVGVTGVDALNFSPSEGPVHYREVGENPPKEKTLYVLSEIKPEDETPTGNKARGATDISFSALATAAGWPSTHPTLGGFSDSELTESQKTEKANYKYPIWNVAHPYCQSTTCKPDHYGFTGKNGDGSGIFTGKRQGRYTVDVNCGTEKDATDPNDNYGVRRRFINVCNPLISASFSCRGDKNGKKYEGVTPCDPKYLLFPITISQDLLPNGESVKITIVEPANTDLYDAYLQTSTGELVPFPVEDPELLKVNGGWSRTLYIEPLKPEDENKLETIYTVKVEYGIAGSDVKADPKEDTLTVYWKGCQNGKCVAGTGGAGVNSGTGGGDGAEPQSRSARGASLSVSRGNPSYIYASFSLGGGPNTDVPGSFSFTTSELNYRVLSDKLSVFPGSNAESQLDADKRVLWTKNGTSAAVFTYTYGTYADKPFVSAVKVKQYQSTDMSAGTSPVLGTQISETNFTLNYSAAGGGEPVVNSISVTNTFSNGAASRQNSWNFTRPASSSGIPAGYDLWEQREGDVVTLAGTKYETVNGASQRSEILVVKSATGAVASQSERIERRFPWGYSVISEGTAEHLTRYTYYEDGVVPRVATETYPDGRTVSYEYNANGDVTKQSETTGGLTRVTTVTYERYQNTTGRTVTSETKIGETVVAKSAALEYLGMSASAAGSPYSYSTWNTRYDENNVAYTSTSYYSKYSNFAGDMEYRLTRQTRPDGTETRYSYSRSGDTETTTTESGYFGSSNYLQQGTRSVSVVNRQGRQLSTVQYTVDTSKGMNLKTAETVNSNFDTFGRAQTTTYLDGSTVTRIYGCCGVESETDRDGVVTGYGYDEFKRLSYSERDGITTLYTYDAAGNQTVVTTKGRNNGELTTTTTYVNGEVTAQTDAMENTTSYLESYTSAGTDVTWTRTTTDPAGGTQISIAVNGAETSTEGTAQYAQSYTYGANWQKTMPQDVTSYTNMLGQNFKTVYSDNSYAMNYFNAKQQLVKSVTPGGQNTLYAYDNSGRQVTSAIDVNANGTIDSADIVTTTAYSSGTMNSKPVQITTTTRTQGSESVVISTTKQSLDGLENWSIDMAGLVTHAKRERLGNGNTRQTVTSPNGTKVITNVTNGRTTTVQQVNSDGSNGNLTTYSYDEFNRVSGVVETFGETVINTMSYTYDANGNALTQTVNGQTTAFTYDNLGRQTKVTNPGNAEVFSEYYPTGALKKTWGADTYTVEYTYDSQGRQATLTTHQNVSTPQVTSWTFNNRGFLTAKTYADGNSVNYTYDADGQLLTRTWSRQVNSQPLVTTYTYDAAGRQTGVSYSDGTPSLSLSYNFLGQQTSITDAAGTRTLTYDATHRLANETNPVIVGGMQTYTYDTYGRRQGMSLGNGANTFAQATYTYDPMGRVSTVGNGADTLTYTYVPGTGMIGSAAWTNATLNTAYTYDSYKRLTGIAVNNTPVYGYTLNDRNQRTGATLSNGDSWAYGYDELGQVTLAAKRDAQNTPLSDLTYWYDQIGNRTAMMQDTITTNYASNLLNQYTQIAAELPTYDTDGNMLTHAGWTYTYNGENRLITASNGTTRLEFDYDYMGRRIFKKVFTNNTLTSHRKFAYDGYKLIAEFDALNSDTKLASYLWQPTGLDVPLLRNEEYLIADGNKNIISVRTSTGAELATYAYDPFGTVTATGTSANPFQFSSEYHDTETGLVYYNYRYYSPVLGRWINRDPIGEKGGVNLYAMLANKVLLLNDFLGLSDTNSNCCGTDVSSALDELLRLASARLKEDRFRSLLLDVSMFHPGTGWDMEPLQTDANAHNASTPCSATRTYHGKCYKSSSMNYILWGLLSGAKNYHKNKLEEEIRARTIWGNYGQSPNGGALGIIDPVLSHWLLMEAYLLTKYVTHDEAGESAGHANQCKRKFFFAGFNAFKSGSVTVSSTEECAVDCECSDIPSTEDFYIRFSTYNGDERIPTLDEWMEKQQQKQKN